MVFLWAFAPVMEEAMGSLKFVIFYVLGIIAAAAAHIYGEPHSTIPMLGASGAVAAVMGAFLVTYPRDSIRTLILAPAPRIVYIPAIVLIGLWIVLQFVSVTTETQRSQLRRRRLLRPHRRRRLRRRRRPALHLALALPKS